MTFKQLLSAKDDAIADDEEATEILAKAKAEFDAATEQKADTAEAVLAAHKAIHDRLVERGAHVVVDAKGNSTTVFTASDDEPGWKTHHPISADADFAVKEVAEATS